ncbi:TatD family hydrolase [Motiliproteus sp. MSK22-1]|uniref:TatD family hydrolase n=1 Tax=Motiliproteus sp. MSK22-1 TaxID=1897630 RepID=UPI000977DB37|nr:TatD family hydrolase [Motiliproteus sp. MSK22-1]OMH38112.1 hypothetical protein BGP75_07515 [Motiliproteus sp. MSK22-1]
MERGVSGSGRFMDTHCHLDFSLFDSCREELLFTARAKGVEAIVVPGVDSERWLRQLSVCRTYSSVYPALGLHPCFIEKHNKNDLLQLEKLLQEDDVVAVGEIGLDFWPSSSLHDSQVEYFESQLELAAEYELPVLLHVRKAHDQVLKRLRRLQLKPGGVVHAFSGSYQQAKQYIELGFCLGVGGALTYERAKRLRKVVASLPLSALVLETDAPDMPLAGLQGMPNRPENLPLVFDVLASLRVESAEELMRGLWDNSVRVLALESHLE